MFDFIINFFNNSYLFCFIPFNRSFIYVTKFLVAIFFLIFIRAGLPRYRYDYLTKLGWSRLVLISLFFLVFNFMNLILWI